MHKHEGIVVVAFKPGQPASQIEADLQLDDFDEFTTHVFHQQDSEQGVAAKVNLYDEAVELQSALEAAGFRSQVVNAGDSGWRVL